jgi:hypothetical protein
MTPSARKTFWWHALAASMGGTAFFVYMCILEQHLPPLSKYPVYIFPILVLALTAFSIKALRRCYHDEPATFRGFWQLSMLDLYAVVAFSALWMFAWCALSRSTFVPTGMIVSPLMGIGYALCLLISTRLGFITSISRIPFAAGLLFKILGWLSLGALALVCSYYIFYERGPTDARAILEYSILWRTIAWDTYEFMNPVRIGLPFLPVGTVICWLVEKRGRVLP